VLQFPFTLLGVILKVAFGSKTRLVSSLHTYQVNGINHKYYYKMTTLVVLVS